VSNASRVAFATFSVPWSINSNRMGLVYFVTGGEFIPQNGRFRNGSGFLLLMAA